MYRRGDVGQVARALRILDGLRGFKLGRLVSDLAVELDASERTVRRDITELQDAGIQITRTPIEGRAAACLVDRAYSYVAITRRERYTLLAVRAMFDVLRGTSLYDDIASVLSKLEQRMTDAERAEHATFGERFAYVPDGGTKIYEGKDDILDAILTGVLSRRLLRFEYRGVRGRVQRGALAAYAIVLYRHGLYVVGSRGPDPKDRAGHDVRPEIGVFAVERFIDATALRETFTPPADFRLAALLHGALSGVHLAKAGDTAKRVVIDFAKSKAEYVRARQWHETQEFTERPDGRLRLTFTCTHLQPIVSWVLEWGPHARVVEPQELVDLVVSELREALGGYGA